MRIPYYHLDAFTGKVFTGNPAGVCMLERWLPAEILQSIAAENNLAETAFLVREGQGFRLRWFTPTVEVDLCGHATLAPAHLLFFELGHPGTSVQFATLNGQLIANRRGDIIELDFPARPPAACSVPDQLLRGLGGKPREILKSRDYFAVFDSEAEVAALAPDMSLLAELDSLGVIATARGGGGSDFVSRFFAPRAGTAIVSASAAAPSSTAAAKSKSPVRSSRG